MIYHGDCLDILKKYIKDSSIDMTLTSPPYDNLRKYELLSLDKFKFIAKELFRVTKIGGIIVWVVGDATIKGSETCTSFKQALYFKDIGFNLHDTMIYQTHRIPIHKVRYSQNFDYMFVFSKNTPKTFNPITIPCKSAGRIRKSNHSSKNGNEEDIFKKIYRKDFITKKYKIKGNIWDYHNGFNVTSKFTEAHKHPAIFPEKLAEDHIISWSNEGDIVLDPFLGSGTTAAMAVKHNRNYIGIEKKLEYIELSKSYIEYAEKNKKEEQMEFDVGA